MRAIIKITIKIKKGNFMDYKETLLLPQTEFAMRGNLVQNEPKRYEAWDKNGVYEKMKTLRELWDGLPPEKQWEEYLRVVVNLEEHVGTNLSLTKPQCSGTSPSHSTPESLYAG